MFRIFFPLCVFAALLAAAPKADPGKEAFGKRCAGCRLLDSIKVGPPLRNVFARPAALSGTFPYSEGLKAARIFWDEASLDRWLTDPEQMVPQTDMVFRLEDPAQRTAIIAYLKRLSGK